MYVCMTGGVVVRPWAQVVSSSLAHAPVEMWCSYSFSITMWCEKSIPPAHQFTQLQMGTWNFLGCKFTGHFSYTSLVQVGLRVPTPVARRDGQSSCEFLARLQGFALHWLPVLA